MKHRFAAVYLPLLFLATVCCNQGDCFCVRTAADLAAVAPEHRVAPDVVARAQGIWSAAHPRAPEVTCPALDAYQHCTQHSCADARHMETDAGCEAVIARGRPSCP